MRYRPLGDSDLEVSEISLGSWLTYAGGVEREHTEACTRRAFEEGINLFDTANVYGTGAAEEVWGEILSGYERSSFVLATKVYFPMSETEAGLSAAQISKQLDASLRRLRTDYVDLYQCHRFDVETPIEETMEALSQAVKSGKVRHLGFSEWTTEQLEAALAVEETVPFASSQPQYNAIWRAPEAELFELTARLGIGNIVWSPLAQGVLTGKYRPGEQPPPDSRAASDEMAFAISRYMDDDVLLAAQRLDPIAAAAGLTMAQLALAWVLRRDEVSSAIVGASRPEQVTQNASASGIELSDEVLAAIDEALADVVVTDSRPAGFAREGVKHR
ncbi:MAG: aldo/keto reductase family protein [Solirubrobacterales bacterium]